MYKVLKELRAHLGWTQEQLAQELEVDTSQISKLEKARSTRSFDILCDRLRRFVRTHPREWVELLASPEAGRVLSEYEDLLFLTPNTFIHEDAPPTTTKRMWTMAQIPTECRNTMIRRTVSGMVMMGIAQDYWVPTSTRDELHVLFTAMQQDDGVSKDALQQTVRIIWTPELFSLMNMAITDPLEDDRLGFLGSDPDAAAVSRVTVLARDVTFRTVKRLEPIYRALLQHGEHTDGDGFTWRMDSVDALS